MALSGFIFDVDGTLVDTNQMHVEAFVRAFGAYGYKVPPDRVFQEIGKGGDNLVPALIGKEADRKDGDAIRQLQPEEYRKIVEKKGIRVFPKVPELIRALRDRAIKTAIATSSNMKQLKVTEQFCGLELSKLVDVLVLADDAKRSKPAPDIVAAAVKKLGMTPAQCAMLGDTPYDAISCLHAGVVCLGVTCGGHSLEELVSCGARAVFKDPADVFDHLEQALKTASPGPIPLTQKVLERLMAQALEVAEQGLNDGEAPIGAVIARGDATVLARGYNRLNKTLNKTAHAEMVAFADAAGKAPLDARDLLLVTTLEPCVMCTGAAMEAAIDTVIYGMRAPADSGTARVRPPHSPESQMPRIVGGILPDKSRKLLEQFLKRGPNPIQAEYVKQLLATEQGDS